MEHAIIVGGGIAGLTTAALLARQGLRVDVLEQSAHVGGRGRTRVEAGFHLNLGPHALYRSGVAAHTFRDLGLAWSGRHVVARGFFSTADALHPLPAHPGALLTSTALAPGARLDALRWFAARGLGLLPHPEQSVADWLAPLAPDARALALAFIRVATYTHAPDRQSAAAAARQVTAALRAGVEYLDGGWQTLVDGLYDVALRAGARVHVGAAVASATASTVTLADGETRSADHVVLAVPPPTARRLGATVSPTTPVRAACLDLGLARLPRPDRPIVFALDRPLYLSAHSAWARLAPGDGATLHLVRYLGPDEPGSGGPPREDDPIAELEAFLDRCQPGWRELVVARAAAPSLPVTWALPEAGVPRPGPRSPEGHWLVGDWVRSDALLLDGAVDSARTAAAGILAARRAAA